MKYLLKVLVLALAVAPVCLAQAAKKKPMTAAPAPPKHFRMAQDQVKWVAPPAEMFTGTPSVEASGELRYGVVQGDPMKAGSPFTVRLACTDGYKAAPHWHPTAENLLVLKGSFALGTGDKFETVGMHEMATGTYGYMPAQVHHFGLCKGETDLLIYGIGPFQINWISPRAPAAKKTGGN